MIEWLSRLCHWRSERLERRANVWWSRHVRLERLFHRVKRTPR